MRLPLVAACVAICLPISIAAQAASPDFTAADQARFAKTMPFSGTWNCQDNDGSKPYRATAKVEGAWLVWRDASANPDANYVRWSHRLHSYVVAYIGSDGRLEVSTSTSTDPLNATWKQQFPEQGAPFTTSLSHGVFTVGGTSVDKNGKPAAFKSVCKKT